MDPDRYKPVVGFLPKGAYHIYDYEFFFENIRENVQKRIGTFLSAYE